MVCQNFMPLKGLRDLVLIVFQKEDQETGPIILVERFKNIRILEIRDYQVRNGLISIN